MSFKKGDTVEIPEGTWVWRRMNTSEIDEWRQDPSHQGPGEDGESQLRPDMIYLKVQSPKPFTVRAARIVAPGNWRTIPKCMALVDSSGQEYWVERRHL